MDRTRHLAFGDLAAVWSMLQRLEAWPRSSTMWSDPAGRMWLCSVGTYIALVIALNRVVDPRSKRAFADWWAKTAGDRFVKPARLWLFWTTAGSGMPWTRSERNVQPAEIERRIVAPMVETFSIDLSGLVFDMTNFAT